MILVFLFFSFFFSYFIFSFFFFFFFNDTATTEIYTLSLHDALPICYTSRFDGFHSVPAAVSKTCLVRFDSNRSEEHTSELQSPCNLVCRLLLEKKKKKKKKEKKKKKREKQKKNK